MMNNRKKALLSLLFIGSTLAAPLMGQDLATALKDIEAERYPKAEQALTQLSTSAPTADNLFYLGYYYLRSGQIDKAKATFEKGAAADPKNQLNSVGLAGVALAQKDRAKAKGLIDNALAQTKNKNQDVLIRSGEMYTLSDQTNDPAEALRILQLAYDRDKKHENAEIDMLMGDAYTLKNDGGNAITKYENALSINSGLAEANYKIGHLYLRGKNYTKAQEYFKLAIQSDPEFAPTYRAYADALANSRAYKSAAQNYELYIQKSGTNDPELLLDVARYKFLAQDYQGAITYLDQLKGKINNPIIDRMYGWAYTALGKNQEAIESLKRFITTAPQKVIYDDEVYLGRAYGQLGTPEGDSLSIAYLEKAAPADTNDNIYREIAQKYYSMKRWDKAAEAYDKTVKNDKKPTNADYLNMGLANYQQGFQVLRTVQDTTQQKELRYKYFMEADSAFDKLAKNAEALGKPYPLAFYYRAQSNYYAYPRAVALSRTDIVPLYDKFLQMATAETDPALKSQYTKSMITAYKFLASNALANKDDAKAKEYLNKVLELDPNDADAKKALEEPKPAAAPAPAAPKAPAKKKA